jgi:hypothetical protein
MTASLLQTSHPSYLALDRLSLGEPSAEVQAHVDGCEACRSHVEALAAPAPASGFVQIQRRALREQRLQKRLWWGAIPVAAAACGLLFLTMRPQPALPEAPVYVGAKGFLSVWIYVKHGSSTALWDGKKQLFVGDRLRLKVDPGRFRRVEAYSVKDPQAPALLYTGQVAPGQSATLPDAWEVDAEPGDERLVVVFSNEPVQPVWPDWLHGKAQPGISVLSFVLPKSTTPDPNPGSTAP